MDDRIKAFIIKIYYLLGKIKEQIFMVINSIILVFLQEEIDELSAE